MGQDAAFGLRQLVDVAVRALSPGTNDPTTAVQAIDRIHDLLRRLADREIPASSRMVDGRLRAILPRPDWDDLVRLAIDEIRLAGEGQLQVARRLRAVLMDLASIAPEARQPILRQELIELEAGLARAFHGSLDRRQAAVPSARGHAMSRPGGRAR
jgi:uncharacterized membrane protein